jgi:hypothetical protein
MRVLLVCAVCVDGSLKLHTRRRFVRLLWGAQVEPGDGGAPAFVVWLFMYGYNITPPPGGCSDGGAPFEGVSELFQYDDAALDFLQQIDLGVSLSTASAPHPSLCWQPEHSSKCHSQLPNRLCVAKV